MLENSDADGQDQPVCELSVPVAPDGSSATSWRTFCSQVSAAVGQGIDATRFSYVPAPVSVVYWN